jgi:hypothetical protein
MDWLARTLRRGPFRPIEPGEPVARPSSIARPLASSSPQLPLPIERRVLSIIHNPVVDQRNGRKLSEALGWNDPDDLAETYVEDVVRASHGLLRFAIVERIEHDAFPPLVDGFRYDVSTYLRCWQSRTGFHQPEGADYHAILNECDAVAKVNENEIDEVWLFGFPWAGYYESIMVGPGAFWCNAPPLPERGARGILPRCGRRFVVMGFNYERGVDCMLEDLGHRTESMMSQVYAGTHGAANLWEHFTRHEQVAPGRASCGNVHFAPNSTHDYDWGNLRPVQSDCDDWLNFPHLTGERRWVDGRDWGNGDMRLHHLWWFERLPRVVGETDGILHNWWTYVADPNTVRYPLA